MTPVNLTLEDIQKVVQQEEGRMVWSGTLKISINAILAKAIDAE
jgi:hypothetical protein